MRASGPCRPSQGRTRTPELRARLHGALHGASGATSAEASYSLFASVRPGRAPAPLRVWLGMLGRTECGELGRRRPEGGYFLLLPPSCLRASIHPSRGTRPKSRGPSADLGEALGSFPARAPCGGCHCGGHCGPGLGPPTAGGAGGPWWAVVGLAQAHGSATHESLRHMLHAVARHSRCRLAAARSVQTNRRGGPSSRSARPCGTEQQPQRRKRTLRSGPHCTALAALAALGTVSRPSRLPRPRPPRKNPQDRAPSAHGRLPARCAPRTPEAHAMPIHSSALGLWPVLGQAASGR
jgi:hypothetical protein